MQLKNLRLQMIYDMVPNCITFADIGTDHALLPICLVQNGKCEKAIASDINEGPLLVGMENIKKQGLEDKIDIRKGSGLETIEKDECQAIVLAGMGGYLITELITESMEKAKAIPNLILQPNTEEDSVRNYLIKNGFRILDENAVREGNHVYLAILCRYDPDNCEEYSDIEYCTGKILYKKKTQGSYDYYSNIEAKTKKRIKGIEKSQSEEVKLKIIEQQNILRWIEKNVKSK